MGNPWLYPYPYLWKPIPSGAGMGILAGSHFGPCVYLYPYLWWIPAGLQLFTVIKILMNESQLISECHRYFWLYLYPQPVTMGMQLIVMQNIYVTAVYTYLFGKNSVLLFCHYDWKKIYFLNKLLQNKLIHFAWCIDACQYYFCEILASQLSSNS